ncbi:hypothetical protein Aperf_G00000014639 [Anoplocephala perfoliata]
MSEDGPEVDGDDSDLKECLLESLKADGTLKQIEDQLSAAVYAAFYQQTSPSSAQVPPKLSFLTSNQNGINALSLLVDFLQTLELKKTLNVLLLETGLDGLKLEGRDDLIHRYNVPALAENVPILPTLLDAVDRSDNPSKLYKAEVLDQVSGNDKYHQNNGSFLENHDVTNSSSLPKNSSNDLPKQSQSPPLTSANSPTKSGSFFRDEANHSTNDRNSYAENPRISKDNQLQRKSQLQPQKSSSPISERQEEHFISHWPSKERNVSINDDDEKPSRNVALPAVEQPIQPQQRQRNDHHYGDSLSSESVSLVNTATGVSVGPAVSSVSFPRNQLTGDSDNPGGDSASHPYKQISKTWNVYRPALQPDQNANDDDSGSSDIDSEVINDVTLDSSRVEGCDYMEPVRRYPRH